MKLSNKRLWLAAAVACLAAVPAIAQDKAAEIMDKAAQAVGGVEAAKGITSMSLVGKVTLMSSLSGDIEVFMKDGGKMLAKTHIKAPGMQMEQIQGCDGENCYSKDTMMGLRMLEGQEKEMMLVQNDMQHQLDWRKVFTKYAYAGQQERDGRQVHAIDLEMKSGMKMTNFYDAEDFMLLAAEGSFTGPMGTLNYTMAFHDYETLDYGFKTPKKVVMTAMGQEIEMTYSDIKINPALDDAMFALPEELR